MNLPRLTACLLFSTIAAFALSSCEKESDKTSSNLFTRTGIAFSGTQIRPVASPSTATGTLDISYDKRDKLLNYTISWSGLTDSIIAIRISGPAPAGYNSVNPAFAPVPATFNSYSTSPYVAVQTFLGSSPRALYPGTGSYTGTMLVDGVKVNEQDLLNGQYFVTLHTKTILPVAIPGSYLFRWLGEVRAQIAFE